MAVMALATMRAESMGSLWYRIDPIEASVVDAETRQPVEGAIVLANWQLVSGGLDGPRAKGQLDVQEVVTDSRGNFRLEGFSRRGDWEELREEDPQLIIFKPGYEYIRFTSSYPNAGTSTPGSHRRSAANGKRFELVPSHPESWGPERRFYSVLDIRLGRLVETCEWKRFPKLLAAMDRERKRLASAYPTRKADVPDLAWIAMWGHGCPSPTEFLRGAP